VDVVEAGRPALEGWVLRPAAHDMRLALRGIASSRVRSRSSS